MSRCVSVSMDTSTSQGMCLYLWILVMSRCVSVSMDTSNVEVCVCIYGY